MRLVTSKVHIYSREIVCNAGAGREREVHNNRAQCYYIESNYVHLQSSCFDSLIHTRLPGSRKVVVAWETRDGQGYCKHLNKHSTLKNNHKSN